MVWADIGYTLDIDSDVSSLLSMFSRDDGMSSHCSMKRLQRELQMDNGFESIR